MRKWRRRKRTLIDGRLTSRYGSSPYIRYTSWLATMTFIFLLNVCSIRRTCLHYSVLLYLCVVILVSCLLYAYVIVDVYLWDTLTPNDIFDGLKLSFPTFTSSFIDLFYYHWLRVFLMTGIYCRNYFCCLLMSHNCVI